MYVQSNFNNVIHKHWYHSEVMYMHVHTCLDTVVLAYIVHTKCECVYVLNIPYRTRTAESANRSHAYDGPMELMLQEVQHSIQQ